MIGVLKVLAVYERKHGETGNGTLTLTEQHLYGASRLGMTKPNLVLSGTGTGSADPTAPAVHYELTNHLDNVLAVITPDASDATQPAIERLTDYYPFGMEEPGRKYSAEDYRYGFQGQDKEKELWGGEASFFKYRISDNRLGRFFSVDPLSSKFPWNSSYAFSENRVIDGVELEGLEWAPEKDKGGNVIDYVWKGYNEDGSPVEGTVAGGTIDNNFSTKVFSSDASSRTGNVTINYKDNSSPFNYSYQTKGALNVSYNVYAPGDPEPLGNYELSPVFETVNLWKPGFSNFTLSKIELDLGMREPIVLASGACTPVDGELFALIMPLPKIGFSRFLNLFRWGGKTSAAFAKFTYASKFGIGKYGALTKLTQGMNVQVHHLIEKRFSKKWDKKSVKCLQLF